MLKRDSHAFIGHYTWALDNWFFIRLPFYPLVDIHKIGFGLLSPVRTYQPNTSIHLNLKWWELWMSLWDTRRTFTLEYETLVATRTTNDGHMNMAFISLLRSNWMQCDPWSERNDKDVLLLNMRVSKLVANVMRLSHNNYNLMDPIHAKRFESMRSVTSFVQWVDEYRESHHWAWHLCVKFTASSAIDVNI